MDFALSVGRLFIFAVFLFAAMGKFADLAGSRKAVRDFGVPDSFAGPLGAFLPVAELLISISLLATATFHWGALAASVLLSTFAVAIGVNLVLGRTPDCHCFGRIHSAPVGWWTAIRALILAVFSGLVAAQTVTADSLSLADLAIAGLAHVDLGWAALAVALTVVSAFIVWFMLRLFAQHGRLLQRVDNLEQRVFGMATSRDLTAPILSSGLPVGTLAPAFTIKNFAGKEVSLNRLLEPGKSVMLVFVDPGCGPCTEMLPDVARWQHSLKGVVDIVLITSGTPSENAEKLRGLQIDKVLIQNQQEVSSEFQCNGTPGAVWIGSNGHLLAPLAMGAVAIAALIDEAGAKLLTGPAA